MILTGESNDRYSEPPARGVHGGPHPLAFVPQRALDAARASIREARDYHDITIEEDMIDVIADGVLQGAIEAWRSTP